VPYSALTSFYSIPSSPYCLIFEWVFFFKVVEKCLTLGAKKIFYIPTDMPSPAEPEKVDQFAIQKLGKHLEHLFGFQVYRQFSFQQERPASASPCSSL